MSGDGVAGDNEGGGGSGVRAQGKEGKRERGGGGSASEADARDVEEKFPGRGNETAKELSSRVDSKPARSYFA